MGAGSIVRGNMDICRSCSMLEARTVPYGDSCKAATHAHVSEARWQELQDEQGLTHEMSLFLDSA